MLSLAYIRDNADVVRRAIEAKNVAVDLDRILELDRSVRAAKTAAEDLRRRRKEVSDGFRSAPVTEQASLRASVKIIVEQIQKVELALEAEDGELESLLLRLPGIPWEGAPVGPDETFNQVTRTEG